MPLSPEGEATPTTATAKSEEEEEERGLLLDAMGPVLLQLAEGNPKVGQSIRS